MSRLPSHEAHRRSLAKAVTWRFTATIDTFVISYIVTGKVVIAGTIAATEIFTKILIYYFHERAWALIPWGRRDRAFQAEDESKVGSRAGRGAADRGEYRQAGRSFCGSRNQISG